MNDFTQTLVIHAPLAEVHEMIAKHGDSWWTTNAAISDRVGETVEFRIPRVGFLAKFRVATNSPTRIEWKCEESTQPEGHGFRDRTEWNGTTVRFVLRELGPEETELAFTHAGLVESMECYGRCSSVWANNVLQSLRKLAETGAGNPVAG